MAKKHYTRVVDRAAFAADPREDIVMVHRTFAFWQSAGGVHGNVLWGRPDQSDILAMSACWNVQLTSPHGADPTLTDFRDLEGVDVLAFEQFVRTLFEKRGTWTRLAGPQAFLHDGSIASATVLGALQLAASEYTIRAFDDPGEALAWLGRPELEPEYDALRRELLDVPDIVRRVRAALDTEGHTTSTDDLARRLGLSVRSLQRRLADAGTTLRAVRVEHLVEHVERLLEGTELDLGAIASMVGLGSAARVVALFREVRGTTPGAFRASRAQQ